MKVATELADAWRGHGLQIDTKKARLARMKASTISGAEKHEQACISGGFRWRRTMVTLTYKNARDWQPDHITHALKLFRQWVKRFGGGRARYVWVAELQKRGAVHYHILVWHLRGMPFWDRGPKPKNGAKQVAWWPHGMSNSQPVRENAICYMVKYASKMANDEAAIELRFPKGLRMHSCGGLTKLESMQRRWALSPSYVREYWTNWRDDVHRARKGGGWESRVTGKWMPSKWHLGDIQGLSLIHI